MREADGGSRLSPGLGAEGDRRGVPTVEPHDRVGDPTATRLGEHLDEIHVVGADRMLRFHEDAIAAHVLERAGLPGREEVTVERQGRTILGRVADRVPVVSGPDTAGPVEHHGGGGGPLRVREHVQTSVGLVEGDRMVARTFGVADGVGDRAPAPSA